MESALIFKMKTMHKTRFHDQVQSSSYTSLAFMVRFQAARKWPVRCAGLLFRSVWIIGFFFCLMLWQTSLTGGDVTIRTWIPGATVKCYDAVLIRRHRLCCVIHVSPRERSIHFCDDGRTSTWQEPPLNGVLLYNAVWHWRRVPFYYHCSACSGIQSWSRLTLRTW